MQRLSVSVQACGSRLEDLGTLESCSGLQETGYIMLQLHKGCEGIVRSIIEGFCYVVWHGRSYHSH